MSGELAIGMRVRILVPLLDEIKDRGVIYNYCPSRPWPWHVRPDDWPCDLFGRGIAFDATEIEPESEDSHEDQ
jgi:hypothetical protein